MSQGFGLVVRRRRQNCLKLPSPAAYSLCPRVSASLSELPKFLFGVHAAGIIFCSSALSTLRLEGYDGDITKYQISAPIQGGNSGGPLFDDKGNLIGINAAKLNVKVADNVSYSIKTSYVLNLIDNLPKSIDLPSNNKLASLPLTEQIKEITKYVVLIKVK